LKQIINHGVVLMRKAGIFWVNFGLGLNGISYLLDVGEWRQQEIQEATCIQHEIESNLIKTFLLGNEFTEENPGIKSIWFTGNADELLQRLQNEGRKNTLRYIAHYRARPFYTARWKKLVTQFENRKILQNAFPLPTRHPRRFNWFGFITSCPPELCM